MFRKIAGFGTCMHISHNAPYIIAVPREIENTAYAKFWEAKKAHYGRYASGVYWRRSFFHWPRLRIGKHCTMLDLLQVDLS